MEVFAPPPTVSNSSRQSPADLFGAPILPGLSYCEDFITEAEERRLIGLIEQLDLESFRFQQWTGKRQTRSFGWHYDFAAARFAPAEPIPDWLLPIKARAAAFADLDDDALVQAMVIRYDAGAGIGWHRDRPVFEHVTGISLGVPATMRFRRRLGSRFERAAAPLSPRSLYLLGGEARHDWEHSIAALSETRWSITFRSLSKRGLRSGL